MIVMENLVERMFMGNKLKVTIVALLWLSSPSLAFHSGSSPTHPVTPDDEHFLVDIGSGLDTGCTFRNGGPLIITLEIDRYVGDVNSDGTPQDPDTLIANEVLSSKARLMMPAFDVDSSAVLNPPFAPEVDKVFFNGHELSKPLTGANNTWIMNEFEVDIDIIKFPSRSAPGVKPTPAQNEIRIDIDTANVDIGEELWCTAIDWIQLHFKAIAPILLVHGIASGPDTWEPEVVNFLTSNQIPFEHEIQLGPNDTIANNGELLSQIVREQAMSFGVEKVHLVVHSKGGLDSRRFLSTHYDPDDIKVLSLHTLSTPHYGSVLSDISVANRTLNDPSSQDDDLQEYLDNDWWADFSNKGPQLPGLADLQTDTMETFNTENAFPSGVKLYTYGADADVNDDGAIAAGEAEPLIPDIQFFIDSAEIGSLLYRVLRNVSSITVTRRTNFFGLNEWHKITPNATAIPQDNDIFVTDTSSRFPNQIQHFGPSDRNHATIKDAESMTTVLDRIRADFPVD